MLTTRSCLALVFGFLAVGGFAACGQDASTDLVELDASVGTRLVLDLITHDTYGADEDYHADEVSMQGCQVVSIGLPDYALFDGQFLVWTPASRQTGVHEFQLEYGEGCRDRIPVESDLIRIDVKASVQSGSLNSKTEPPTDVPGSSGAETVQVHDLESLK